MSTISVYITGRSKTFKIKSGRSIILAEIFYIGMLMFANISVRINVSEQVSSK